MAAKVEKCSVCGARYDANFYNSCPYCAKQAGEGTGGGAGKRKFFRGSKSTGNGSGAIQPEPVRNEPVPSAEPNYFDDPTGGTVDSVGPTQPLWGNPLSRGTTVEQQKAEPEIGTPEMAEAPQPSAWAVPEAQPAPQAVVPAAQEPQPVQRPAAIQPIAKTTAKYVNTDGGDVTYPAVGWLLAVKGVYYGKSFPLKNGMNYIGRSTEMDVPLLKDESVSRAKTMNIVYDSRGNTFSAMMGEGSVLCYINGEPLYERKVLNGLEEIEFGDGGNSKYLFVPLCGDHFHWDQYPNQTN